MVSVLAITHSISLYFLGLRAIVSYCFREDAKYGDFYLLWRLASVQYVDFGTWRSMTIRRDIELLEHAGVDFSACG